MVVLGRKNGALFKYIRGIMKPQYSNPGVLMHLRSYRQVTALTISTAANKSIAKIFKKGIKKSPKILPKNQNKSAAFPSTTLLTQIEY